MTPTSVIANGRAFPPTALVLAGSTVITHRWGITRWHALGRAARYAHRHGAQQVYINTWVTP